MIHTHTLPLISKKILESMSQDEFTYVMSTILLNDYALHLYYIIPLKSVEVSKLQVAILALSSREMYQTVRIVCKHILSHKLASQFGLAIFLFAKNTQNLGKPDRPRLCLFEWSSDARAANIGFKKRGALPSASN